MALIKCPECGKDVSDKSKNCIHCGYPLKEDKGNKKLGDLNINMTNLITNGIYLGLSFILFLLFAGNSNIARGANVFTVLGTTVGKINKLAGGCIFIAFIFNCFRDKKYYISKIMYGLSLGLFLIAGLKIAISKVIFLPTFYIIIIIIGLMIIYDVNKNIKDYKKYYIIGVSCLLALYMFWFIFMNKNSVVYKVISVNNVDLYKLDKVSDSKKNIKITVTNNYINVRTEPLVDSIKLGKVVKGSSFKVLDIVKTANYRFYKISDGINTGYIANPRSGKDYVKLEYLKDNDKLNSVMEIFTNWEEAEQSIDEVTTTKVTTTTRSRDNNGTKTTTTSKVTTTTTTTNKNGSSPNTTTTTATNTTTTTKKANNECQERRNQITSQYNSERQAIINDYNEEIERASNDASAARQQCRNDGYTSSLSYYQNQYSNASSQYSSLQREYQRAIIGNDYVRINQIEYQMQQCLQTMAIARAAINCLSVAEDLENDVTTLRNNKSRELDYLERDYQRQLSELNC